MTVLSRKVGMTVRGRPNFRIRESQARVYFYICSAIVKLYSQSSSNFSFAAFGGLSGDRRPTEDPPITFCDKNRRCCRIPVAVTTPFTTARKLPASAKGAVRLLLLFFFLQFIGCRWPISVGIIITTIVYKSVIYIYLNVIKLLGCRSLIFYLPQHTSIRNGGRSDREK